MAELLKAKPANKWSSITHHPHLQYLFTDSDTSLYLFTWHKKEEIIMTQGYISVLDWWGDSELDHEKNDSTLLLYCSMIDSFLYYSFLGTATSAINCLTSDRFEKIAIESGSIWLAISWYLVPSILRIYRIFLALGSLSAMILIVLAPASSTFYPWPSTSSLRILEMTPIVTFWLQMMSWWRSIHYISSRLDLIWYIKVVCISQSSV